MAQAQITLRLPAAWLTEAAALTGHVAWGAPMSRADVLRMALRTGLDTLDRTKATRAPARKATTRKPRRPPR